MPQTATCSLPLISNCPSSSQFSARFVAFAFSCAARCTDFHFSTLQFSPLPYSSGSLHSPFFSVPRPPVCSRRLSGVAPYGGSKTRVLQSCLSCFAMLRHYGRPQPHHHHQHYVIRFSYSTFRFFILSSISPILSRQKRSAFITYLLAHLSLLLPHTRLVV